MREVAKRERLPNRRGTESVEFEYAGQRWVLNVGRYADGRLAEVFVHALRGPVATSELAAAARDWALTVSVGLQHGATFEEYRSGVTRLEDGAPASIAGRVLDEVAAL